MRQGVEVADSLLQGVEVAQSLRQRVEVAESLRQGVEVAESLLLRVEVVVSVLQEVEVVVYPLRGVAREVCPPLQALVFRPLLPVGDPLQREARLQEAVLPLLRVEAGLHLPTEEARNWGASTAGYCPSQMS